jgi:hypothetical protein
MKFRREQINVEFRFYEKLFLGTLLCELTCLPENDHAPDLLKAEWLQRELKLAPSKGFRVGLLSEEVQQKLPAILKILTPEDADFVLGLLREWDLLPVAYIKRRMARSFAERDLGFTSNSASLASTGCLVNSSNLAIPPQAQIGNCLGQVQRRES